MRLAPEVSTRLKVPLADDVVPVSELVLAGRPTGTDLQGGTFEAGVAVPDGFLIFLTEGVPEEERLSIYLVDAAGRLLDRANIGQWATAAAFSDLEVESDDTLRFRFLGDGHWRLRLLPRSGLRLPLLPEAPCVTRPFGFTRRFVLSTDSSRP
jgi:hypothetical protein